MLITEHKDIDEETHPQLYIFHRTRIVVRVI